MTGPIFAPRRIIQGDWLILPDLQLQGLNLTEILKVTFCDRLLNRKAYHLLLVNEYCAKFEKEMP